jgi:hypothetical protein
VVAAVSETAQPVVAATQPVVAAVSETAQPVVAATHELGATAAGVASKAVGAVMFIAPVTEPATIAVSDILGYADLDSLPAAYIETPLQSVTVIAPNSPQETILSLTSTKTSPIRVTEPSGGVSTDSGAAASAPTGAGQLAGSTAAPSSTSATAFIPIGTGAGPGAHISQRLHFLGYETSQSGAHSADLSPLASPTPGRVPPSHDLLLWLLGSGHGSLDSSSASGSSAHGSLFADLSKPSSWSWSGRRLAPGTVSDPDEMFFSITEQPG